MELNGLQTVRPPDDSAASQFGRRSIRPRVDSAAGMRTEKWLLAYKLKALIFLKRDDEIALGLRLASRPLKVENRKCYKSC